MIPAFNEAAILHANLSRIVAYLRTLETRYRWEIVAIDDGSTDGTGEILDRFAAATPGVWAYHHITNFGLGQALKFGFSLCNGDYVVTLDADLSYEPAYIEVLVDKIVETRAKIVIASPYMKGGNVSNVPRFRRLASLWANRFLATASNAHVATLTGMVRAYDAKFLRSLNFRSMGMEANADIIRQAQILRARIVEIPAHLSWHAATGAPRRRSSMRVGAYSRELFVSTFLFRPVMLFALPGSAALAVAGAAFALRRPALARFATTAAIQLLGLAALSLQTKRNFEDLFNLITAVYKHAKEEGT